MAYKKLISPEFRVSTEKYEITNGMEVECFSSRESRSDWCKVGLAEQLWNLVTYEDMERARVELGYEDDYDTLLYGYCRRGDGDYWKEILIRDDMLKVEQVQVKGSFVDCTPQDIIRYVLIQAGIDASGYQLSDESYGKKELVLVPGKNGIDTIAQVNTAWGIDADYFFRDGIFYWGCKPPQKEIYILAEDETILSLDRYGSLYEVETLGVPWIHHSEEVEISHQDYTGIVKVEKTIVRSDERGYTRMYVYFKGDHQNG